MSDIDFIEAYQEATGKKPEKQAVLDAYDSYLLIKKTEKIKTAILENGEQILEIFRIVSASRGEETIIEQTALKHMSDLLFWDQDYRFHTLVMFLKAQGKIIWTGKGWKLAPKPEDVKT